MRGEAIEWNLELPLGGSWTTVSLRDSVARTVTIQTESRQVYGDMTSSVTAHFGTSAFLK